MRRICALSRHRRLELKRGKVWHFPTVGYRSAADADLPAKPDHAEIDGESIVIFMSVPLDGPTLVHPLRYWQGKTGGRSLANAQIRKGGGI